MGTLPYLFGLFMFWLDRPILLSVFSPCGISSPSVWIWIASSSGLVRIDWYRPFRSDVLYVRLPVSSGISSSSSSSSSFVSDTLTFRFWTILSFPFRMSRSISSHRPYFPSSPLRQCRFFGVISALVKAVSLSFFFSV